MRNLDSVNEHYKNNIEQDIQMQGSNVVIAGANKSGTTSLFRYLSDHPDVCPSSVKETDFFLRDENFLAADVLDCYGRYFSRCDDAEPVWLEASPGYLARADVVAERMSSYISSAKLVFCLRSPVQRLLSYYFRNRQTQFHPALAALDLDEFVELLEKVVGDGENIPKPGAPRNAMLQYDRGRYAAHLGVFSNYFPDHQICILTFDELAQNTLDAVKRVSRFIGVSDTFYNNDYVFTVENQNRDYRLRFLQKTGSRWGRKLEVLLNRAPWARKLLRKALLKQPSQGISKNVDDEIKHRLEALYKGPNADLKRYLSQTHPEVKLPEWLM